MKRQRVRVAEGIYDDAYGRAATVKVGRIQREHRFPPDTALEVIKSWQVQTRANLDEDRRDGLAAVTGTLQFDGDRFLTKKKGRQAYKADRSHMRAWYPTFGRKLRSAITRELVEHEISTWREAGVAARTIRHRCRVLRECYRSLDGPRAKTPVDYLKLPKIPPPQPIAVPTSIILKVAHSLKATGALEDYARFLVRATTGQRPAQIMRAQPDDIDAKRKIWWVKSAKGGEAVPLPLNAEMVAAWKVFAKANAWGTYDTAKAADVLRAHGWPKDTPPRALRSTFAIDHLLAGTDIGDLQGLLGHTQIQTTRASYAPVLTARLKKATARRRLGL